MEQLVRSDVGQMLNAINALITRVQTLEAAMVKKSPAKKTVKK